MSNIKLWSDTAPCNFNRVLPYESIIRLSDFKMGIEAIIIAPCLNSSAFEHSLENFKLELNSLSQLYCVDCIYSSGPVFGGSKQITGSPVRKGLYLLGMHYSPWCRGRKWLRHNASNKYLRSQASADNKPDWINSIEISLLLFPGKINTYRSYIGMI